MIVTLKNTYDVGYKDMGSAQQIHTQQFLVDNSTAQINPGDPVIVGSVNPVKAAPAGDGDGVIGTDVILGIAAGYSTQTSALDGVVDVFQIDQNTVLRSRPKVNFANQAAADAVIGNRVVFDLTNGKYTIDAAASSSATNALIIVAADAATQLVDFKIDPTALNYLG